jgi:hypothetical protein
MSELLVETQKFIVLCLYLVVILPKEVPRYAIARPMVGSPR